MPLTDPLPVVLSKLAPVILGQLAAFEEPESIDIIMVSVDRNAEGPETAVIVGGQPASHLGTDQDPLTHADEFDRETVRQLLVLKADWRVVYMMDNRGEVYIATLERSGLPPVDGKDVITPERQAKLARLSAVLQRIDARRAARASRN